MFLLDDLLLFPVKGVMWLGEKLRETADAQSRDVSSLRRELDEVERRKKSGEISDEEFDARVEEIFAAMERAREQS